MNPVSMSRWGDDPNVWDPVLFQNMAAAGCTSARIGVNWDQIEPVQGMRDWSSVDTWVNLCLSNNIEPVLLINSTPLWAMPSDYNHSVPYPTARYPASVSHTQDFQNWCFDLARRYRGRARYYEFWNEANGYGWYTALVNPPTYNRADLYTPWMILAYKSLKLADPTCQMSTTGIDDGGGAAPGFLQGIYSYGGQGYFDAVADHPYPQGGGFQSSKLSNIRSTLDAQGDTKVNVWITEFGFGGMTSPYTQYQSYMTDYYNTLTLDQFSYVRIATWHTANDFPEEAGYGLMDQYLNPKPVYTTFQGYTKPSRVMIYSISMTNLSSTSTKISFTTDHTATGLVMYGPDTNYGNISARETSAVTRHTITLVGLNPASTYHFRIRAGTTADTDGFSVDVPFTTNSGAAVHITSGPTANVFQTTATISWTTDVASSSTVQYSTNMSYGSSVTSAALTTSHSIVLTGLTPLTNYQYRVVSSASGYADGVMEGHAFTSSQTLGVLMNGGFEQGTANWKFWEVYPWRPGYSYLGHVSIHTTNNAYPPTPFCMEGTQRVSCEAGWVNAIGGLYQTVPAENRQYLVSGWVAAGCGGATQNVQLIAMDGPYTGGIPSGTSIAYLASTSPWTYYSGLVNITTGQLTVALLASQWDAVSVVAGFFDGISLSPVTPGVVSALKKEPAGEVVTTDDYRVVTAVIDANTVYLQDPSRAAGIKVVTTSPHHLNLWNTAKVCGTLTVKDGEACITSAIVTDSSDPATVKPLGMKVAALGGGQYGMQPPQGSNAGVNNIGLLVRCWGKVTSVSASRFTLSDGWNINVSLENAATLVHINDSVSVTGVSSLENTGSTIQLLIRARSPEDIKVY